MSDISEGISVRGSEGLKNPTEDTHSLEEDETSWTTVGGEESDSTVGVDDERATAPEQKAKRMDLNRPDLVMHFKYITFCDHLDGENIAKSFATLMDFVPDHAYEVVVRWGTTGQIERVEYHFAVSMVYWNRYYKVKATKYIIHGMTPEVGVNTVKMMNIIAENGYTFDREVLISHVDTMRKQAGKLHSECCCSMRER
jgi:hypothetical protein